MSDLEQWRTFWVVSELKSFRRAAEHLHCTVPAVSRRIQALERTVGQVLLHRTAHMVELTAAGQRLRPYAERLLQAWEEGLRDARDPLRERLVIAGSPTTCDRLLPPIVAAFRSEAPIVIRIFHAMASDVYDYVHAGEVDVGFTTSVRRMAQVRSERVYVEAVEWVAAPDLLAQLGSAGARKWPVIAMQVSIGRPDWRQAVARLHQDRRFAVVGEAGSFALAAQLAAQGLGLALLPASEALPYLQTGALQKVSIPDFPLPERHVYLVIRGDRGERPVIRRWVQTVRRLWRPLREATAKSPGE